jgi:hypothetical protein
MIRLGVLADLAAATDVYRSASLSNAGDRDNQLAHPGHLILRPEGLAGGRTYVAERTAHWLASPPGSKPTAPSN